MKKISISWIIPLILIIFILISSSLNLFFSYLNNHDSIIQQEQSNIRRLSEQMQSAIEHAASHQDFERIRSLIAERGSEPDLHHLLLLDSDLSVIAAMHLGHNGESFQTWMQEIQFPSHIAPNLSKVQNNQIPQTHFLESDSILIQITPIQLGLGQAGLRPNRHGLLLIIKDIQPSLDYAFQLLLTRFLLYDSILILIGLILIYILNRLITVRVTHLAEVATRYSQGLCPLETKIQGSDEIAYLASSMESMGQALDKNQSELQQAHNRLLAVLDGITANVFVVAVDSGQILYLNQTAKHLVGNIQDISQLPFCPPFVERILPQQILTKEYFDSITQRWYLTQSRIISWFDSSSVRIGLATDITNRKELEEKLKRTTESLEQAQRLAKLSSWSWEIETGRIHWSKEIFSTFELPLATEPTIGNLIKKIHPEDRILFDEHLKKLFSEEASDQTQNLEIRVIISEVQTKILQTITKVENSNQGARVNGAFLDITERKNLEKSLKTAKEEAEQASQFKSQFLANMSHEIRTPLNAILGTSELLQEEIQPERHRRLVSAILQSGRNLLGLLNDILDLSKIEAGKMKIYFDLFDIYQLLHNSLQIFEQNIKTKGLEFHLQMPEDLPPYFYSDENRLRQVLYNLLGNAIKFTHQGSITVSVDFTKLEPSFGHLRISIADTGIGISPEHLDQIFISFQQVEGHLNRKYEGTGLGLSISTKLMELLGGTIEVKSEKGRGSEFTLVFDHIQFQEVGLTQPAPCFNQLPDLQNPEPFPTNSIQERQILVDTLEAEFLPKWEELRFYMELKETHQFAKSLLQLGQAHKANLLYQFAMNLQIALDAVDVDQIQVTMMNFPAIVEQLKK